MDRRQRRTRASIHRAFQELLAEMDYAQISVARIIGRAGVGRTTFYAHFEGKDALLDDVCETIFQHVFNTPEGPEERHDYSRDGASLQASFAHLLSHIAENDMGVADLLRGRSGEVVQGCFQRKMYDLASEQIGTHGAPAALATVPRRFLAHHVAVSLMGAIHWWLMHGMREHPEQVAGYLVQVMGTLGP